MKQYHEKYMSSNAMVAPTVCHRQNLQNQHIDKINKSKLELSNTALYIFNNPYSNFMHIKQHCKFFGPAFITLCFQGQL